MSPPRILRDALATAASDRALHLLLAVFLALSLAWNWLTPIFEAPDEPDHLQYILFVADEWRVPNLYTDVDAAGLESVQPPLYYFIAGGALRLSGLPHPFSRPTKNPMYAWLTGQGERRFFLPFEGAYGYVRLLRGLSALFGLVTVACAYMAAAVLGATRPVRLAATAVAAFLPQFTFLSGTLSNDTLATALASITLVWLLYVLECPRPSGWRFLLVGVLSGLTFLAKPFVLWLPLLAVLLLVLTQRGGRRAALVAALWIAAGFSLSAGWYLVMNQMRYGDLTGFTALMKRRDMWGAAPGRRSLTDPYLYTDLPFEMLRSFLGVFGWFGIALPAVFYWLFAALWLVAFVSIVGTAVLFRAPRRARGLLLVPLLMFLGMAYMRIVQPALSDCSQFSFWCWRAARPCTCTLAAALALVAFMGSVAAVVSRAEPRAARYLFLAPLLAFLVVVYVNLTFVAPQGRYLLPALDAISLMLVLGLNQAPRPFDRALVTAAPLFLLVTNVFALWFTTATFARA